jgi:hypothetical protein
MSRCNKYSCLKEINPEQFPGIYFGEPRQFDPNWYGCYLCQRNSSPPSKLIQQTIPIEDTHSTYAPSTEVEQREGYHKLFKLLTRRQ